MASRKESLQSEPNSIKEQKCTSTDMQNERTNGRTKEGVMRKC